MTKVLTKAHYEHEMLEAQRQLNRRQPRNLAVYLEFCEWWAAPIGTRKMEFDGIMTQKEWANKYGVAEQTLVEWKKRPEFYRLANEARFRHMQDRSPEIFEGLIIGAKKGYAENVELYLNYFEGWSKKQVIEQRQKVDLHMDDIRNIIQVLPQDDQQNFYETIGKLLHKAKRIRDTEPVGGASELPAASNVPDTTDKVSGDIQRQGEVSEKAA